MGENIANENKKVLIFSTGAKGGVGKSTMAILMVEALLEGGGTVACLEGDEHSPTLSKKYSSHEKVRVANVDLSSLIDASGMDVLGKAVAEIDAEYVIVNTPASGVRIFDEFPEVLASLDFEPRAAWSLGINADRIKDGAEDDGLFTSMDGGMLSAIAAQNVTVVRPLFQRAYRDQNFWYDARSDVANRLGINTMDIAKIPASTLEAIHRGESSISGLVATLDPILSATLQILWYRVKTAMAETVLKGAGLALNELPRSLPVREKVFGEDGLARQLSNPNDAVKKAGTSEGRVD